MSIEQELSVEIIEFEVKFEGPALLLNEMSVEDFAPSLLNTARVFEVTSQFLNPVGQPVRVNVTATRRGSFGVDLKLVYDAASNVLSNPGLLGLEVLIGTVVSVITLRKQTRDHGGIGSVTATDHGQVNIIFVDHATINVTQQTYAANSLPGLQRPLKGMVAPLTNDGIETFKLIRSGEILSEIQSSDVDAFSEIVAPSRELLLEETVELYLTIRSAAFDTNLTWRFITDAMTLSARITDEEFIARIEGHEAFAKGDLLMCRLKTSQYREADGDVKTEYEIVKVLKHERTEPAPGLFGLTEGP